MASLPQYNIEPFVLKATKGGNLIGRKDPLGVAGTSRTVFIDWFDLVPGLKDEIIKTFTSEDNYSLSDIQGAKDKNRIASAPTISLDLFDKNGLIENFVCNLGILYGAGNKKHFECYKSSPIITNSQGIEIREIDFYFATEIPCLISAKDTVRLRLSMDEGVFENTFGIMTPRIITNYYDTFIIL